MWGPDGSPSRSWHWINQYDEREVHLSIHKVYNKPMLRLFSLAILLTGVTFLWQLYLSGSKRLGWLSDSGASSELEE